MIYSFYPVDDTKTTRKHYWCKLEHYHLWGFFGVLSFGAPARTCCQKQSLITTVGLHLGSLTVYAVGRKLTIMYLVTGVSSQDIHIVLLKWHSIDIEIFFKLNSEIARRAINFFVTAEMFCIWCKSSPFMRLFIFNSLQNDVKLEPHNMHALTWNLSKRVPVYQNLERMIPSLTLKH